MALLYLRYLTLRHHSELQSQVFVAYIWAYLGGLVGGRLLSMIVEDDSFEIFQLIHIDSLTFYGSLLGSFLVLSLWAYFKKVSFLLFWDLMSPPLLIGLCIGRVGCFLNGDDFGIAISANSLGEFPWWSVSFPNHEVPIPRVPVQLLEAFGALAIGFLLGNRFSQIQSFKIGLVGSLAFGVYAILRFMLEFLRDDYRGWFLKDVLSTSQGISLFIVLAILCYQLMDSRIRTSL